MRVTAGAGRMYTPLGLSIHVAHDLSGVCDTRRVTVLFRPFVSPSAQVPRGLGRYADSSSSGGSCSKS